MSKYNWYPRMGYSPWMGMVLGVGVLILVAILMGCRPWRMFKKEIVERIDIDISVDYCGTDSEGNKSCVSLIDLDNVEELILTSEVPE